MQMSIKKGIKMNWSSKWWVIASFALSLVVIVVSFMVCNTWLQVLDTAAVAIMSGFSGGSGGFSGKSGYSGFSGYSGYLGYSGFNPKRQK